MANDYRVNNLVRDEFGRPSGIVALNKEAGISSHDLVNKLRKKLGTRKVGHAGALDVFASGLLILLVGKSTKLADTLIKLDKEYVCRVVLGVATDTQDPEGKVIAADSIKNPELIKKATDTILDSFLGKYRQHVSIYSSVKVNGQKLRVMMRDDRFRADVYFKDPDKANKFIKFTPKEQNPQLKEFEVEVPAKEINFYELELLDSDTVDTDILPELAEQLDPKLKLYYLDIRVACSKGTYIRQFAEDLGTAFGYPAMLASLQRTQVGKVRISDATNIDHL